MTDCNLNDNMFSSSESEIDGDKVRLSNFFKLKRIDCRYSRNYIHCGYGGHYFQCISKKKHRLCSDISKNGNILLNADGFKCRFAG